MGGRKPDFDITVAVPYVGRGGEEKTQWHNVGAGWISENGAISFSICTMPGVKFVALKKKAEDERRAA